MHVFKFDNYFVTFYTVVNMVHDFTSIRQLEYNNVEDAMDALHNNEVRGIIRLPSNYSTSLSKLFTKGPKSINDTDGGFADFWLDNSSTCLDRQFFATSHDIHEINLQD